MINLPVLVILGFIILELANVLTLYFKPASRLSNGVGVFTAWEKSKNDPEIHDFVKYMVNWVAGTKLIFISLLVVILLSADQTTLNLAIVALVLSISTFFWRLFPLIRKMDRESRLEPENYSAYLGLMILSFMIVFLVAPIIPTI
ncbi:MAG: hypothetical protein ACXAEU_24070 [Candidatus Hodarchaeales archaeon]